MEKKKHVSYSSSFKPICSIIYISQDGIANINPESITMETIGEKAFGLSCLPKLWTLPFIVISGTFLSKYNNSDLTNKQLLEYLRNKIAEAANIVGIQEQDNIIVRSSGCSEGINERGKYYSVTGNLSNIIEALDICFNKLSLDKSLNGQRIPLIIQKYVIPISAMGHLSNERRCYEDIRDWLGEYDDRFRINALYNNFEINIPSINLRNWRKKITSEYYTEQSLDCNLADKVKNILEIPATWATEKKVRVHFEWVWDGNTIYVVQADKEHTGTGVDPTKNQKYTSENLLGFEPKCLKRINEEHALKYAKIKNVFTYNSLGWPIDKLYRLYILDDQHIIEDLASGYVSPELEADIHELVKGSLVIRMDILTDDEIKRKMLPRTQEEREINSALNWLKINSAKLKAEIKEDLVFIFHNFVPAVSSAFAFAAPGERKVQIEALWGLPEGLYYFAHDKYIVDTQTPRIKELDADRFTIVKKYKYKHYFISPDADGRWTSKILRPSYDWKGSIQDDEWIKIIALESRRIAEEENKSLSIMWFINVPTEICEKRVLPWYHEYYDPALANKARRYHPKTPFDKVFTIKTKSDIEDST